MRLFSVIVCFACGLALLGSCRSTRKIQEVISKKDTTSIVIVHPNEQPDSLVRLYTALRGMYAHRIDFTTFSAKVKVAYSNAQGSQPEFTATIRMKKDSVIWIDISAALGIVNFRVLITPDTVRILDRQANTVSIRPLSHLEEVAEIPFDFQNLQDLLVGNLIFFDSTRITAYRQSAQATYLLSTGALFKTLVTMANSDNRIKHVKLDDVDPTRNRTADLTYDDYIGKGDILFSTTRSIGLSEKSRVDIELNFKQFEFNVDLFYPFSVPKKYKIIR